MFSTGFGDLASDDVDLYPAPHRAEIDALNARVYETVNNAVYVAGFSRDQDVYEETVCDLFETLDELDARLASRRYLFGDTPAETDWRLFTTLLRFDAVYAIHFKCSLRRVVDHPQPVALRTRPLLRSPESPRPSASTRSATTTTGPTRRSTRAASSPCALRRISPLPTAASSWARRSAARRSRPGADARATPGHASSRRPRRPSPPPPRRRGRRSRRTRAAPRRGPARRARRRRAGWPASRSRCPARLASDGPPSGCSRRPSGSGAV